MWTIKYSENQKSTDKLVKSMCQGINARRRLMGGLAPNSIPEEEGTDYITYRGGGRGDAETKVKCKDFCAACNNKNPGYWSCDEYPPATFLESSELAVTGGESLSTRVCIPIEQNRRQGGLIRTFTRRCSLQGVQQKIKVRIEGLEGGCQSVSDEAESCEQDSKTMKRQSNTDSNPATASDGMVIDLLGDGSQYAVALDLGEVPNGTHSYRVDLNASIDYLTILASDGYEYAAQEGSEGTTAVLNIALDDAEDLTLWAFLHDNQAVNISYTLNNATSPPPPQASTSGSSSISYCWPCTTIIAWIAVTIGFDIV